MFLGGAGGGAGAGAGGASWVAGLQRTNLHTQPSSVLLDAAASTAVPGPTFRRLPQTEATCRTLKGPLGATSLHIETLEFCDILIAHKVLSLVAPAAAAAAQEAARRPFTSLPSSLTSWPCL